MRAANCEVLRYPDVSGSIKTNNYTEMKKIILFALVSLSGLSLSAQFKGRMNFNSMGETRSFAVHSADAGYRYDFDEDGQRGAVIVRNGSGEVIILMPQQKMAMKSPADSPMSQSNDPLKSLEYYQKSGVMKEEGQGVINGIECTKSTLYDVNDPSQKLFTLWFSDTYKFPMKMVNHIDGTENSGMEMSDVEPWIPDPQFLEIPDGYQVMEMPVMPGKSSVTIP